MWVPPLRSVTIDALFQAVGSSSSCPQAFLSQLPQEASLRMLTFEFGLISTSLSLASWAAQGLHTC